MLRQPECLRREPFKCHSSDGQTGNRVGCRTPRIVEIAIRATSMILDSTVRGNTNRKFLV